MLRRRFLALSAAAALAALAGPAAAQQLLYVQDTSDGYLNLRSGPGSNTKIRLRLTAGTELVVLGAQGAWVHVSLPDGLDGWVHSDYVGSRYFPQRNYDVAVQRTNDGYLNLRSGPGTGFGILRRLHAGQRLFALGHQGSWVKVQLPEGTVGWVSGKYLQSVR